MRQQQQLRQLRDLPPPPHLHLHLEPHCGQACPLLNMCRPSNKELAVENKVFYFAVGENQRGRFLRISESGIG